MRVESASMNIEQIIKSTLKIRNDDDHGGNKIRMKKKTESYNQGHEEYLHESRHLCGYVISVLNENLIKLSNI